MITNCGYHWHLQYDDGQRTSEEGRRLSLMQPTTLLGCHGFGSIFAAEMWGSGRFFFWMPWILRKSKNQQKHEDFGKPRDSEKRPSVQATRVQN